MEKAVVVNNKHDMAEVLSTCCGEYVTATVSSRDWGVPVSPDGYCTAGGQSGESEILHLFCAGCGEEIIQDFEWQ